MIYRFYFYLNLFIRFTLTVLLTLTLETCIIVKADSLPTSAHVVEQQKILSSQPLPTTLQVQTAAKEAQTVMQTDELMQGKFQGFQRQLGALPVPPVRSSSVLDQLFAQVKKPLDSLLPQPQLLILVSFSMPEAALRNLIQQAEQVGGVLVLRGLVNDSLQDTAKALKQLTKNQQSQATFQVNPNVFTTLHVTAVPTFVLAKEIHDTCEPTKDYVAVSGDVTLDYALERLGQSKGWESKAQVFRDHLKPIIHGVTRQ